MQKQNIVENLISNLKDSTGVIATNYQGLKADELNKLKRTLKVLNAKYQVVKNSAMSVALKTTNIEKLLETLSGPTGMLFIKSQDPFLAVKKLVEFSKEYDKLKIKSGYLFNRVFSAQEISKIAELPSKEILIGRLITTLKLPLARLINVLQSPQRKIIYALQKIHQKKIMMEEKKTSN